MVWIIALPVISVFLFLRYVYRFNKRQRNSYFGGSSVDDLVMTGIFTVLIVMIAGMVGVGAAAVIGSFMPKQWEQTDQVTLVSLHDEVGVNGRFFLGSGTINSDPYYYYYVGSAESGYSPRKLRANEDVTVFEEERTDGELVVLLQVIDPSLGFWGWFGISIGENHYQFHIPKESLRQSFSLG